MPSVVKKYLLVGVLAISTEACSHRDTAESVKTSSDLDAAIQDVALPDVDTRDVSITDASDDAIDASTVDGYADTASDASPYDAADPRRFLPPGDWIPFADGPSYCETYLASAPERVTPGWTKCPDRPGCDLLHIPWHDQEGQAFKEDVGTFVPPDVPDLGSRKVAVAAKVTDIPKQLRAYDIDFRLDLYTGVDWAFASRYLSNIKCMMRVKISHDKPIITIPGTSDTYVDVRVAKAPGLREFDRYKVDFPSEYPRAYAFAMDADRLLLEYQDQDTLEPTWFSHFVATRQTTVLNPNFRGSTSIEYPVRTPLGMMGLGGPVFRSTALLLDDKDQFHVLLDPPQYPVWIHSLKYDQAENQIVWTQYQELEGRVADWSLWAAPLVPPPEKLKPRLVTKITRRPEAFGTGLAVAANAGIAPIYADTEKEARIIRLSDGKAWRITPPKGFSLSFPVWADENYVWYVGAVDRGQPLFRWPRPNTFIRYSRKELGEPTLPNGSEGIGW